MRSRREILTYHRGAAVLLAGSAAIVLLTERAGHGLPCPLVLLPLFVLADLWDWIVAAGSRPSGGGLTIGCLSIVGFVLLGFSMARKPRAAAVTTLVLGAGALVVAVGGAIWFSSGITLCSSIPFLGAFAFTLSLFRRSSGG